jgi:DNA-binding response OmpR family regulator
MSKEDVSTEQKPRVLLVDDDHDSLSVLQFLFKRCSFEVETATDGDMALDTFRSHSPNNNYFDFIALDIRLPRLNGNELASKIRDSGFKGVMIAMTVLPSGDGEEASKDYGFDYYFSKQDLNKEVIEALVDGR